MKKFICIFLATLLFGSAIGIGFSYKYDSRFRAKIDDLIYQYKLVRKKDFDSLNDDFDNYKSEKNSEITDLNKKLEEKGQENNSLKNELDKSNQKNEELKNQNDELQSSNEELNARINQLAKEVNIPYHSIKCATNGVYKYAFYTVDSLIYSIDLTNYAYIEPRAINFAPYRLPENFCIDTVKYLTGGYFLINDNMIFRVSCNCIINDFNNTKSVQLVGNYVCFIHKVKTNNVFAPTQTQLCVMTSSGALFSSYTKNSIYVGLSYFNNFVTYTNNISSSKTIVANFKYGDDTASITFNISTNTFTKS